MAHYDIHIVPQGEEWVVIREGDGAPVSVHASRSEAEHAGRQLADDGGVRFTRHPSEDEEDPYHDDPRNDE